MNMLQATLGIGCVVLAGALWSSCSSASTERHALESALGKLSNDWSQAVVQLNEQSALAYTLQTQLKLVQEEHHKTTNQLPSILTQLQNTTTSNTILADLFRTTSNRLQLQVLELQDQYADATQHVALALQARSEAQSKSLEALANASQSSKVSQQLSNQLHQTQSQLSALESTLRDPALLKSHLDSIEARTQASPTRTAGASSRSAPPLRIQLNSNGFVEPVASPHSETSP